MFKKPEGQEKPQQQPHSSALSNHHLYPPNVWTMHTSTESQFSPVRQQTTNASPPYMPPPPVRQHPETEPPFPRHVEQDDEPEDDVSVRTLVQQLTQLGFSTEQCQRALQESENNLDDAAIWLTMHASPEVKTKSPPPPPPPAARQQPHSSALSNFHVEQDNESEDDESEDDVCMYMHAYASQQQQPHASALSDDPLHLPNNWTTYSSPSQVLPFRQQKKYSSTEVKKKSHVRVAEPFPEAPPGPYFDPVGGGYNTLY